jgi:Conserved TM helix
MFLADVDIGNSIERGFTVFFAWLPALIAAVAILVIGYFVAKLLGNLVARVLSRVGLDRTLHGGPAGGFVQKITHSPSRLLGRIAFWAAFLGAISLAVTVLGIDALTNFMGAVFAYLPNVIAALLIFLVAGAVAAGVATLAQRFMGETGLGKIIATVAPIIVMTIATFMILDQLKIAEDIVVITYAALLGAVALGSALAFGLGGRDVARQLLEGAYQKGQDNKDQFKRDLDQGMQRAREDAERVKDRAGESADGGNDGQSRPPRVPSAVAPQPHVVPGEPAFEPAYEPTTETTTTRRGPAA